MVKGWVDRASPILGRLGRNAEDIGVRSCREFQPIVDDGVGMPLDHGPGLQALVVGAPGVYP